MCRPRARPAAASLAASLPAYGSPGDTPVGCREWRLVGLEQAPAWGGGGGPTCKASRGLAASSQPYPAPPPLFPVALRTSPKAQQAVHCTRVDLGFLCAEPPPRAVGLRSAQEADLGAGATDQGLTGTRGDWCQGVPGVHAEAWWVPDTGAQRGSGCGQRREGLLPYSSRPGTCWGRLVREVEELEAGTLGREPPSGPSPATWGGRCDGGDSRLATESSGARTRGRVALPL